MRADSAISGGGALRILRGGLLFDGSRRRGNLYSFCFVFVNFVVGRRNADVSEEGSCGNVLILHKISWWEEEMLMNVPPPPLPPHLPRLAVFAVRCLGLARAGFILQVFGLLFHGSKRRGNLYSFCFRELRGGKKEC